MVFHVPGFPDDLHLSAYFNERATGDYRPLNERECELAYSIYGDYLDYSQVKLHSNIEDFLFLSDIDLKVTPNVVNQGAVAPNNHIYFSPICYRLDYSFAAQSLKSVFLHELSHVFQFQNGVDTVRCHFKNKAQYPQFSKAYEYSREDVERGFGSMNTEQQSQFVQNLFDAQNFKLVRNFPKVCDYLRMDRIFTVSQAREIWHEFRENPVYDL